QAAEELRGTLLANKGAGLRILTGIVTSPALADQLQSILKQFPEARWHQYEPLNRDAVREGAKLAFGEYVNTVYRFDQAEVVLALDADFMTEGPAAVRYARDFAEKRRVSGPDAKMNRLYAVESTLSVTGSMADHRARVRARDVEAFARALAGALGVKGGE